MKLLMTYSPKGWMQDQRKYVNKETVFSESKLRVESRFL